MHAPGETIERITDEQECPDDCFFVQRMAKPLGRAVMAGEIDIERARKQLAETLDKHCPEMEWEPLLNGKRLEFPACSYDYGSLAVGENPFDFIEPPGWVKEFFGDDIDIGPGRNRE